MIDFTKAKEKLREIKEKRNNEFHVIIAGGRLFDNYPLLKEKCDYYLKNIKKDKTIVIYSGKAKGADSLGERYAKENNFQVKEYPANWDLYKKRAGYLRNEQMAIDGDALIAFWDGESKGTKHMIDIATKENLMVKVVKY